MQLLFGGIRVLRCFLTHVFISLKIADGDGCKVKIVDAKCSLRSMDECEDSGLHDVKLVNNSSESMEAI